MVHARSERADVVTWAREWLAVASDQTYAQAAAMAGRRSVEAVNELVARFNQDGLAALEPHGKGGTKPHLRRRGPRTHPGRNPVPTGSGTRRNGNVVFDDIA